MRFSSIAALLGLSARSFAGVAVQVPGLAVPPAYSGNRDAVVTIFNTSYNAYRQFAFGHDELLPVSLGSMDDLGGWGATIVDSLGTMLIMGLTDFFEEALNFMSNIDFNAPKVAGTVSLFETTIRFVGGLLSAYELSGEQHPILLSKAQEVGDKLTSAWINGNILPYGSLNFVTNQPTIAPISIAAAGTLSLEGFTLSQFTGNATYGDLTSNTVIHIASLPPVLPGMAGQVIDPATNQFTSNYITWGASSDSYWEYLVKYARLTNTNNTIFMDTWKTAVDSSIKTLLRTSTVGNHTYLADLDNQRLIRHIGSHLACYAAGNWLLGGKLLQNQTIIEIALEINDGCWNTYASDATGIGPEGFAYISADGSFTGGSAITAAQQAFYNQNGFYVTSTGYIQRPEVLESNFYAWRITGDTKYLDRAEAAIASFNKFLPATAGFAGLNDVNSVAAGLNDETQSFWFAEVLKYLCVPLYSSNAASLGRLIVNEHRYLTFDDPAHISLDDYVFNTECHPLKAPPALDSYGS